jgi:hypothetical protein
MTDYDIMRIAKAVCSVLTSDERFMKAVTGMLPKERLLTATQAADLLGCSVFKVRRKATELGGILQGNGRWMFREEGLVDRYLAMP